jgi:hypothetical protein
VDTFSQRQVALTGVLLQLIQQQQVNGIYAYLFHIN